MNLKQIYLDYNINTHAHTCGVNMLLKAYLILLYFCKKFMYKHKLIVCERRICFLKIVIIIIFVASHQTAVDNINKF